MPFLSQITPTLFSKLLIVAVGSLAGVIANLVTNSFVTGAVNTIVYAALAWVTKIFLDYLRRDLCRKRKGGRNG